MGGTSYFYSSQRGRQNNTSGRQNGSGMNREPSEVGSDDDDPHPWNERPPQQRGYDFGPGVNRSPRNEPFRSRPRLKPIEMTKFSGKEVDGMKYINFRCEFEVVIDSAEISPLDKLLHLLNYTTDAAKRKIEDLVRIDDSYAIAWNILDDAYGQDTNTVQFITDQLNGLKTVPMDDVSALDFYMDKLNSYLRTMDRLEFPEDMWVNHVMKKLPKQYVVQIMTKAGSGRVPRMAEITTHLKTILATLRTTESIYKTQKGDTKQDRPFGGGNQKGWNPNGPRRPQFPMNQYGGGETEEDFTQEEEEEEWHEEDLDWDEDFGYSQINQQPQPGSGNFRGRGGNRGGRGDRKSVV
jgi:hypothetical protein